MRRTHSCLLDELGVDAQVRADQMGHSVDVNQKVHPILPGASPRGGERFGARLGNPLNGANWSKLKCVGSVSY